jgi:hypothetical protein
MNPTLAIELPLSFFGPLEMQAPAGQSDRSVFLHLLEPVNVSLIILAAATLFSPR